MATLRPASSDKSVRSPGKRFKSWGKAGDLQKYIHRAADVHAVRNPSLTKAGGAPRTERDLAKAMAEQAGQARDYMRDEVWRAVRSGSGYKVSGTDALAQELNTIVQEYEKVLQQTAAEAVRASYGGGKAASLAMLADLDATDGQPSLAVSFSRPDRAAMAALANDLFTDLAGQTENMARAAVAMLRTEAGVILQREMALGHNVRDAARNLEAALIAGGYALPASLKKLTNALPRNPENGGRLVGVTTPGEAAAYLEDGGMRFVDKAGKAWDLRTYTEMAAKTKLFIARNEAAVATMADAAVYHWRANVTAFECDYCDDYEGEIFWTGEGDAAGYSTCPAGLPPWHPNCEHYVIPEVLAAR